MAKFGYAEYPLLKMVETKYIEGLYFFDGDENLDNQDFIGKIRKRISIISEKAKERIDYLTNPFIDCIYDARDSLLKNAAWNAVGFQTGIMLNLPTPFTSVSAMYAVSSEGDVHSAELFLFQKDIFVGYLFNDNGVGTVEFSETYKEHFSAWFCSIPDGRNADKKGIRDNLHFWIYSELIAALNFIKYAQVEIKQLPPNKKAKEMGVKYVNQSQNNINILDSKWFTTLVKSDAFKVSGHFRLQPFGEGLREKKLIWINDFEKSGYTAPARKLSNHIS